MEKVNCIHKLIHSICILYYVSGTVLYARLYKELSQSLAIIIWVVRVLGEIKVVWLYRVKWGHKEKFHLVWVLGRGVKKRPQKGRRGFIWLNYWKMIRCDLAVLRQLECPHPSHTLLSTYRQLFMSVFQVAMPTL